MVSQERVYHPHIATSQSWVLCDSFMVQNEIVVHLLMVTAYFGLFTCCEEALS